MNGRIRRSIYKSVSPLPTKLFILDEEDVLMMLLREKNLRTERSRLIKRGKAMKKGKNENS